MREKHGKLHNNTELLKTANSLSSQLEKMKLLETELEMTRTMLGERDITIQLLVRKISREKGEDLCAEVK